MFDPLPFDRKSRDRLKRIAELLKQAGNDTKLIEKSSDTLRLLCVSQAVNEINRELSAIDDQIDAYGSRRQREAEALKRRLPAPKPVIVTPVRAKQMMLLPSREAQS